MGFYFLIFVYLRFIQWMPIVYNRKVKVTLKVEIRYKGRKIWSWEEETEFAEAYDIRIFTQAVHFPVLIAYFLHSGQMFDYYLQFY